MSTLVVYIGTSLVLFALLLGKIKLCLHFDIFDFFQQYEAILQCLYLKKSSDNKFFQFKQSKKSKIQFFVYIKMQAQVKANAETLQQKVSDTIMRDLKNIWTKLKYVIVPKFNLQNHPQAVKQLRNWDLWGPLILCLVLSFILSLGVETHGKSFGILFLIMWGGSFVVTINTKLLGGHISFFQCVCVLGYCVFPVVLAAAIIYVLKIFTINFLLLKIGIAGAAIVWSTFSSLSFMNVLIQDDKKIIATYPIFIFYLFIGWFVLFI